MRINKTKERLRQGKTVLGTWLEEMRSPAIPHLLAAAGLDFLIVDMEHGAYTMETMADIVRMARLVDITPIVRVPDLTGGQLGRILDAGAQGLMLPRVETPEQVQEFVAYLKYPPAGRRGMASGMGNTDFRWVTTPEYIEHANREMLVIVQIENGTAVANLRALAQVPGVDVLFIGPEDLSISLGFAGQQGHPHVQQTIQQVIKASQGFQIAPGIHTSDPTAISSLHENGVRLIAYASDIEFLFNGALQGVQALQEKQP
jgi:2-dehydro-3-deoxyglucarate aldolase/4-hydroxy-2-oxoheptanedioate aldolase